MWCKNHIEPKGSKKGYKIMKKTIINIITIICVIWIGWIAWSFIDVVSDNNTQTPTHADTNFFALID